MKIIRVTKEFNFEMGHALFGYDGACKNIHGHSYKLKVCLMGKPIDDNQNPNNGMVIDFRELKSIIKENIIDKLDHSLMLNQQFYDNNKDIISSFGENVLLMPFQPTCENILLFIVDKIKELIPNHLVLFSVYLRETQSSYAEWFANDNN